MKLENKSILLFKTMYFPDYQNGTGNVITENVNVFYAYTLRLQQATKRVGEKGTTSHHGTNATDAS